MQEDTIFTKIIKGEIPAHKIYEDERNIAILDTHPVNPGHVLVIPKVQIGVLWELSDADYTNLMKVVKDVAKHMQGVLDAKRIGMAVEGSVVPHVHVHLIPINMGLEAELAKPKTDKNTPRDLEQMAKRLKM